ncbi:hypothetical protein LAV77_27905 [Priestia megaterium]|uniref:hypothetical protein n=1 Tax=Priestia megaterium TaxID=1404 RepID=UPI002B24E3BA|nr:hypothetical protein [Priestia megaterium]MEB2268597.1 hypothetical protein [Priestia megaterium]
MNKRFITSFLVALVLCLGIGNSISYAKGSSSFSLKSGMSSATTSRVTVNTGEKLHMSIYMTGASKGSMTYTIFKSGKAYTSGSLNGTTVTYIDYKTISVPKGDYSMRVYSSSKTGSAYGGLEAK